MAFQTTMKALFPFALGLLGLGALVREASSDCDGSRRIDGCSIPLGFFFPYKKTFRQACNRHDVCYGCGSAANITRSSCDEAFLRNMTSTCTSQKKNLFSCVGFAMLYYQAVRKVGESRYRPTALEYCEEDWVAACLP